MEMIGEQRIDAAQSDVWHALNDPVVLKSCIPGCESIEKVDEAEFKIVMLSAVGPVKARFAGSLAIRNAVAPSRYDLVFEGSGGIAGFGKGTATVSLAPDGETTLLRYAANAQVGGRLAQVGSRLIDSVAKKLAIEFFARFNRHFSANADLAAIAAPKRPTETRSTLTPAGVHVPAADAAALQSAAASVISGLVVPLRIIAVSAVISGLAFVGILLKLLAM